MSPHALKTSSFILFLAALYNAVWGAFGALWPGSMLELYGIADLNRVELWQCLAMLVGVYGAAYALAAANPAALWPIVLAGFLGKLLGALLGAQFEQLTPRLRRFHDTVRPLEVRGSFRVERGTNWLANWLTDRSGFPRTAPELPVVLRVEPQRGGERWHRRFGDAVVESWQDECGGVLRERYGPLVLYLQASVQDGALVVRDLRSSFAGVPLPPFLTPRVDAHGIDVEGGMRVRIRVDLVPFGRLVEYGGVVNLLDL